MCSVETTTVKFKSQNYVESLLTKLVKLCLSNEPVSESDEIVNCLYGLVEEAQEHAKDMLSKINQVVNVSGEENKKMSFNKVVFSLLEDNIKWSRVIVTFMYIIEVLKISKSEYSKYFDWSVELICREIEPWVKRNGGWNQIVQISKNRNNLDEMTDTFKRVGKVVLGITGLFAIGKWMFN